MIRCFLLALSFTTAAVSVALAEEAASESPAGNDLLLAAEGRLIVLRVAASIDGKPLATAWEDFLDQQFRQWDSDGDGVLKGTEMARVLTRKQLQAFGVLSRALRADELGADFNPADGQVTRAELKEYYDRIGFELFGLAGGDSFLRKFPGPSGASDSGNGGAAASLFRHLDRDENKQLGAEELDTAWHSLRKRDFDRDGLVSIAEISTPQTGIQYGTETFVTTDSPAPRGRVGIFRPGFPTTLVADLMAAYDRPGRSATKTDGHLSPEEVGLSADVFAKVDIDEDGYLDFDELQRFVESPLPDVTLNIRLGKRAPGQSPLEFHFETTGLKQVGGDSIRWDTTQLDFTASDITRSNAAHVWQLRFKNLDRDGNGYLDTNETERAGINAAQVAAIDPNSDDLIYEDELLAAIVPLAALNQQRVVLRARDLGRDLFRLVDIGNDGRIGPRELHTASLQVARFDTSGDHMLAMKEIPHRIQLSLGRGFLNAFGVSGGLVIWRGAGAGPVTLGPRPVWFQRMDRNTDGDVAVDEFLGSLKSFHKLDQNGDGLLDPREAASGDSP